MTTYTCTRVNEKRPNYNVNNFIDQGSMLANSKETVGDWLEENSRIATYGKVTLKSDTQSHQCDWNETLY